MITGVHVYLGKYHPLPPEWLNTVSSEGENIESGKRIMRKL
jgi:hypothetical protein